MVEIDPSIALGIKPAQIDSPLAVQAQGMALAAKKQEIQEQAMKMAEQQKALAEQDTVNRLYVSSAGENGSIDPQKFLSGLAQSNLGHLIPAYQDSFDKSAKSGAEAAELRARAKKADQDAALAEADYFGGIFAKIKAANYDPVLAHIEIDNAEKKGHDIAPFQKALQSGMPLQQAVDAGIQGSNQQRELLIKEAEQNKPISVPSVGLTDRSGNVLIAAPSTTQSKPMLVDGKPAEVVFDPKTKKYTIGDQEIAATRIAPIPPAAVQAAGIAGQDLPEWATTPNRPTADGNKFDSKVGMTPNGLYQAAITNIQTGQLPPIGRGSDERSKMVRAALNAKIGAIADAAGMDVPALRAFYKSNAASLTKQQAFADSAEAFLKTADKNSELLESAIAKIPDTGSPLLNAPVRSISQKALGSVDMSQFKTYLASVQNEYAKILNNPNLSGQLTDAARGEAQHLVSGDATVAQILGSLQALRAEGSNRLSSIGEQIQKIQGRMNMGGGGNTGASGGVPKVGDTFNGGKVLSVEKVN